MRIKLIITTLTLFLFLSGFNSLAAQPHSTATSTETQDRAKDKVESLKRSYVITKSGMSPDEVTKFWPLYQEYLTKKKELKGSETGLGAESDRARADLKDEYYNKYVEVMPKEKVDKVVESLKDFRKELAEILKNGGKLD